MFHLTIAISMAMFALFSCSPPREPATPKDLLKESMIPLPDSVMATGSSFRLTENTNIYINAPDKELKRIAQYLADQLNPATGLDIQVIEGQKIPRYDQILLEVDQGDAQLGAEGYELNITEERLILKANELAGLFYGIQTLRQLLPARIEKRNAQAGPWELASGVIRDFPDYAYRGAMLDVARHFFEPQDVKQFIDHIAAYKMNHLHLHLTDDQGWRIEIKSWPRLTTHGGSTEVGGGEGGFYTQEEYSDIVQYAADRFITIVPEIDMPGHTNAALSSYAELNCNGKATKLYTGTKVGFSTLCTRDENTYKFVDDVVKELAALTPGPYIHLGGDESDVTPKKDYIYFVERVQDIVQKHGKQMIGWEEIAQSELKDHTVVHFWKKAKYAEKALTQDNKVIVSLAHKAYLDMKYHKDTKLGLTWAGFIEVDTAYNWQLENLASGLGKEHILGIEAPLWGETITNIDDIEFLTFPRLPGYAEIGWTKATDRDWEAYKVRLGKFKSRFEAMDIDYYPSPKVPWVATDTLGR